MAPTCRHCRTSLETVFCDLGSSPLANSYLSREQLERPEAKYPLRAYVCAKCLLVQLEEFVAPSDIFSDYAYFSSYSDSWVAHAKAYVESMLSRFAFGRDSLVMEIASNDGYLLQFFKAHGIPVLGIEPAANVAKVAEEKGIATRVEFFNRAHALRLAGEGRQADLLIGNNVLAHVHELNDFVQGLKAALKPRGIITLEFPHLLRLIEEHQFDTIYHEHFSYFSLHTVERVFAAFGLRIFDVDELSTHGGSLRIYAAHSEDETRPRSEAVAALKQAEAAAGLLDLATYRAFSAEVASTKASLLAFLERARAEGKTVVGYGAPAKAITLLNYCGVGADRIAYTVDRSPAKQGRYLPGVRIPIHAPERIRETRPDYVLILPWNLKDEIASQMSFIGDWGGRFVIPIPSVKVLP